MLSHSNGAITIFTNYDMVSILEFLDKWLSDDAKMMFKDNVRCSDIGAHFPKFHGTVPILIETKEATEIPVWISVRSCSNYADFHLKILTSKANIKFPSNKDLPSNASTSTKRHYHSEREILEFVKKKGTVKTSDCKELGIDRSTFYRDLEKIIKKYNCKLIERTSIYPAIYSYVGD